jgi:D-alanyl-D-alanine endopeptidase (penicillin-binding protein 7)
MLEYLLAFLVSLSLVTGAQTIEAPAVLSSAAELPSAENKIVLTAPKKLHAESMGIGTASPSVFVADVATSQVLYAKRPHDVQSIASLTKLMTAMVILDARLDLDEPITIVKSDLKDELHVIFSEGDVIKRRDLLKALIVGSVNAAGTALARTSLGQKEFVAAMNQKARQLNLVSPVFVDPVGIDPDNRASAADVAALMSLSLSYPEIRKIAALSSVSIPTAAGEAHVVKSTNLLLNSFLNDGSFNIVGAKTGSLPEAGYCMAQVTSDKTGHEVVVVSLGGSDHFSRFQDIKALTAWVFDNFAW